MTADNTGTSDPGASPKVEPAPRVSIGDFSLSPPVLVGTGEVVLAWQTKDAGRVEIVDRESGKLIQGTNFRTGRIALQVSSSTRFEIRAYSIDGTGGDDRPATDVEKVVVVRRRWFFSLLGAMSLALVAVWYSSEGILHGIDIAENAPELQAARGTSRLLALLSTIVGAPLVASLLRLRSANTLSGVMSTILQCGIARWATLLIALVFPFLGVCLYASSTRVYFSSELERPVHFWECPSGDPGTRTGGLGKVRLTVPSGVSSALLVADSIKELTGCPDPRDIQILYPKQENGEELEAIVLRCDLQIQVLPAQTEGAEASVDPVAGALLSVEWDDGSVTRARRNVARKRIPHCDRFPHTGIVSLRSQDESRILRQRLLVPAEDEPKWPIAVDRLHVQPSGGVGDAELYVTASVLPIWMSTTRCSAEGCELWIPKQEQDDAGKAKAPSPAISICVSPIPPPDSGPLDVACDQGTWSLTLPLEDNGSQKRAENAKRAIDEEAGEDENEGEDEKKRPESIEIPRLAPGCIPASTPPTAELTLTHETTRWRGSAAEAKRGILWPDVPAVVAVDGKVVGGLEEAGEAPRQLRVAHTRLPRVSAYAVNEAGGPLFPIASVRHTGDQAEKHCQWFPDEASVRRDTVVFTGLPSWAKTQLSTWEVTKPNGQRHQCKLHINQTRHTLKCGPPIRSAGSPSG